MQPLKDLFEAWWRVYVNMTPCAGKIVELLHARGETIVNDHIALRTFDIPGLAIEDIDRVLVDAGYVPVEQYEFVQKKLVAYHYEHEDPEQPKIFISSLLVDQFSENLQKHVDNMVAKIPPGAASSGWFLTSGRHWPMTKKIYEELAAESEYAGWLAAFGFCANHFTISVNHLNSFPGLTELNEFLLQNGIILNQAGGLIKGTPAQFLEQSSTQADAVPVEFDDGALEIPSCYYEFAKRYPMANGELYTGFIAESANFLFESTNREANNLGP